MKNGSTIRTFLAAAAALLVMGCASGGGSVPAINTMTGQHPATWLATHWNSYVLDPASCEPCHGSAAARSAVAPTSGVTCFGCHQTPAGAPTNASDPTTTGGPDHATTWNLPVPTPEHGLSAMMPATAAFNAAAPVFSFQGFASCTPCHGELYNNASGGYAPSCYSCHTTAPHPPKPWGAGLGLPATQPRHDLADPSNAPECAKCHTAGQNSSITPVTPAAPGTAPGCFNGTLCHNTGF